MKRSLILLTVVAIVVTIAPTASAEHCWKCKIYMGRWSECLPATGVIGGYTTCVALDGPACTVGEACAPHESGLVALAERYEVASVERLDEPRTTTTSEPRLAALTETEGDVR